MQMFVYRRVNTLLPKTFVIWEDLAVKLTTINLLDIDRVDSNVNEYFPVSNSCRLGQSTN